MSKNTFIYMIKNKVNGMVYIGQTRQGKKRWTQHRTELRNNKHYNTHLQNSWNRYGEDNFEFSVVEYCELDDLNDKERYWISRYNSMCSVYGYNNESGGGVDKITKNRKRIFQYNKEGLIRTFDGLKTSRKYGFSPKSVEKCCRNKKRLYKGFIFSYYPLSINILPTYYTPFTGKKKYGFKNFHG